MPSITPFVRAGYTVWCINYPLCPESQHPAAIVSTLRALHWLRKNRNVAVCVVIGDSAGGQLATSATAVAENPRLLSDLKNTWGPNYTSYHPDEINHWSFPKIIGCVSLYGVLDSLSWVDKGKRLSELSWLENKLSQFALELCCWSYCKDRNPAVLHGRTFFCDMIQDLDKFPPALLICGTLDILVHSSRRAAAMLKAKGFECRTEEYEARHAFVGLPPALYFGNESWKTKSAVATSHIIDFCDECFTRENNPNTKVHSCHF